MKQSLSQRWERVRTVPGLGRDVGAVALLVVSAVVAGLIMQSKMSPSLPWEHKTTIKVEFESVPGVNPASSHKVTMAGVQVGKIVDWEPTARGTAILDLEIDGDHPVYDNARAVLRPKNPLNDMAVEINPGGPPGKELHGGDVLPVAQTERPVQLDEVLSHLDSRAQLAVTDLLVEADSALVRAPANLPEGLDGTSDMLQQLQPVSEALQTRRAKISELVSALAGIAGAMGGNDARTARLISATQDTLGVLSSNDADLRSTIEQLPGVSAQLRKALASTADLTTELNPTLDNLGDAAGTLPPALARLRDTVDQVDHTVTAAKPFLKAAVPVVADLRPLVDDTSSFLHDMVPVTASLDQDTSTIVSYMNDVRAFVYNTSSVFGAGDSSQTGIIRGHLVVPLVAGGVLPGGRGGYSPEADNAAGAGR